MRAKHIIRHLINTIMDKDKAQILWFDEVNIKDVGLVGGKNASLGEMYRQLSKKGVSIPFGFAVTANAYREFLKYNKLDEKIAKALKGLNTFSDANLSKRGTAIRQMIVEGQWPAGLEKAISANYKKLAKHYKLSESHLDVAVRSSATAEDLPNASFAGQQESYLNITGETALLEAIKKCFASLYNNRAISYRVDQKFSQTKIALSVAVQKMVRSDKGASGIMFSLDTDSGFRDVVLINAVYGLGENAVQGVVNPDEFIIFKPTLADGYKAIVSKNLGEKALRMIYSTDGSKPTKNINVPEKERNQFAITDAEAIQLAKWAVIIEKHYGKPMDMEWAFDGVTKKMFMVQARPETVESQKSAGQLAEYIIKKPKVSRIREGAAGHILVEGVAVGSKVGVGAAHIIHDVRNIGDFKQGEVLVTEITDPDWEPAMKIAAAIVTNSGGRTSHAAIVSRELGIPAVVGTKDATHKVKSGQEITVSCCEGEVGKIYLGKIPFEIKKWDLKKIPETKTRIMMNVGDPEQAYHLSFIPNAGIGLAREEFIITDYIKVHPQALLSFKELKDKKVKEEIEIITRGYDDKTQFYVDKLAYGIGRIASAFYPKDVIVRMSDFKTNEYEGLLGGTDFEPHEENPMLGWRGCARYYDPKFAAAFGLECAAIKKVRNEMGLKNVIIMFPMVRTVEEGKKVLELLSKNGLKRGKDGLKVYMMAEIPCNVILAEQFGKLFDGFSIGSNDLTQLTLGLDRDSKTVSHLFDERNDAVTTLIKDLIHKAHACKPRVKVGICGQAPSDYPEFAEMLVKAGIDSISLNPDVVIKTILLVAKAEKKFK